MDLLYIKHKYNMIIEKYFVTILFKASNDEKNRHIITNVRKKSTYNTTNITLKKPSQNESFLISKEDI